MPYAYTKKCDEDDFKNDDDKIHDSMIRQSKSAIHIMSYSSLLVVVLIFIHTYSIYQ